jgi:general secretion pathway protein D
VRYKRQDVGLTLKITPQINDDEQVQLEIELEVSSIKSADPVAGPNISKKKASTTSVVGDQQTIVIGGLVNDTETKTTKKVPILGDIPILGFLFRHKSSLKQKSNLLIFLTPYIIRSEEDFRYIFNRKMAERREFIERWTAFEHHRVDPHLDWSRTSGVISEVNRVVKQAEEDEELRRLSELSSDIEHNPKEPLGLNAIGTRTTDTEAEEPGSSMSLSEVKKLLDAESGRGEPSPPPEAEAPAFEMTPVEDDGGWATEETAP